MNHRPLKQILSIALCAFILASCASNEIGQSKDVNQQTIYQHYRVEYNEKERTASLLAQFRFAGENGTTLVLTPPARLEFNGNVVPVDSNDFNGAFYSATFPSENVLGKHTLVFTDGDEKQYENSFFIDSFYLTEKPTAVSRKAPALLKFKAPILLGNDFIMLESEGTDSSFSVKQVAGEQGGYITIPAAELQRQKSKQIFVVPILYREISLQQQSKEGGELIIMQTLKPVALQLVDEAL